MKNVASLQQKKMYGFSALLQQPISCLQTIPDEVQIQPGRDEVMTTTQKQDEQISDMSFAVVYPVYVAKVEKKGRTAEELD